MAFTTTTKDVIFCGHGAYTGGANNFDLPPDVELWILQPVGTAIAVQAALPLLNNTPVNGLELRYPSGKKDDLMKIGLPTVYGSGKVPDLVLYDLGAEKDIIAKGTPKGSNHVVTVTKQTKLSELMQTADFKQRVAERKAAKAKLRVFWAACATAATDPNAPAAVYMTA